MNPASWDLSEIEPEDGAASGRVLPTLVSLHFLRSAIRRRRIACLLGALLGLTAATAYLVAVPVPRTATTTLVLAHEDGSDPTLAMATDVSLATTRTVAQRTIAELDLAATTPEQLLKSVEAEATTSDVMTLTMSAPTDREAVRNLQTFTTVFLRFRANQLSAQSKALVDGMNARIEKLKGQVAEATERIGLLTAGSESSELGDLISVRAQLNGQISILQESVQDENIKTVSLVASSRVIDPPAAVPSEGKRRPVLALMAGLIAGSFLSIGLVLFLAITSVRLRRRLDVAMALEVPVRVSVGRLAPLSGRLAGLPLLSSIDSRRAENRRRLAQVIEAAVSPPGGGQWLAVGCVDNADEVRFGLAEAAMALQRRGVVVRLADLTEKGNLNAALRLLGPEGRGQPAVSLLHEVPSRITDIGEIETYGPTTREIPVLTATEVCLVLADLNPSIGVEHLTAWTQRVVVAVTAGASSAERVRSAGSMLRTAGLELWCAVLLHAEAADESSGLPSIGRPIDDGA
jgi:capsular polysaccharide biosynthesis protein